MRDTNAFWEAPEHLFWICGDTAYTKLPGNWAGNCTVGIVKPAFFLLPKEFGAISGITLFDDLRTDQSQQKREIIQMGGD